MKTSVKSQIKSQFVPVASDNGVTVEQPAHAEMIRSLSDKEVAKAMAKLAKAYKKARAAEKAAKAAKDAAGSEIKEMLLTLGLDEYFTKDTHLIYRAISKEYFDGKSLKAAMPLVYEQFVNKRTETNLKVI